MSTLGTHLFWPLNKNISHKENKIWGAAGKFTFARPWIALLIVAAITLPPILLHTGTESFNSLDEISDKYPSKKVLKSYRIVLEQGKLRQHKSLLKMTIICVQQITSLKLKKFPMIYLI